MVTARPMTDGSKLTSDDWVTPKWLAALLGPFDLDPCSNARSHISAVEMCTLDGAIASESANVFLDGLTHDWRDSSIFCNPPYGSVMPWAAKLAEHRGAWCALLKFDPTTRWFATLMTANPIVSPFRKRIKFEGTPNMTANFPSVLVYRAWVPSRELEQHLWIARYA